MAVIIDTNQYKYNKKGPLDAKALVKTYADLLKTTTWTVNDSIAAYNGMITAVWLDKDDNGNLTDKNGIYFLHDKNVTKVTGVPDVENADNWHRLGGLDSLPDVSDQITAIQNGLKDLQEDVNELQDSATEVVESLPETGKPNKLYVVAEEATTYVWHNGKYILVGDGADDEDIQIINGGKAI
jgi:hypothetical protein